METLLEQALSLKLMEEVNTNIQLRMQVLAAQAKIKELEDAKHQPETSKANGSGRTQPEIRSEGGSPAVSGP